jgi:hypothetical protein
MAARCLLSLVFGAVAAGAGVSAGAWLAGESWSPGAVGFPLLLALPGLSLMASAFRTLPGRYPTAVTALAVALLGLDVTDSARDTVATAGFCLALAAVLVAMLALVWRRPLAYR